jgi:hypothetical protein
VGVVFHRCLAATDVDHLWLEGLSLAAHLEHDNPNPTDNHVIRLLRIVESGTAKILNSEKYALGGFSPK